VSEEQSQRVSGYLESGRAEGPTAVVGGGRFGDRGFFIEPTVLTNTHGDMKVVKEEIFGPVVVAAPFSDLDEIAAKANDTVYGLGAGIRTKDTPWPRRSSPARSGSTATKMSAGVGLQAGGEGGVVAGSPAGQVGRFCCSMYWRRAVGARSADPAK